MNCRNCGAPVHGSTCEYCGTKYHIQVIDPYDIDYNHRLSATRVFVDNKPIEKYQVKSRHLTHLIETGMFTVNQVRRLYGLEEI